MTDYDRGRRDERGDAVAHLRTWTDKVMNEPRPSRADAEARAVIVYLLREAADMLAAGGHAP